MKTSIFRSRPAGNGAGAIVISVLLAMFAIAFAGKAWSADPVYTPRSSNVAVGGYDVTEYFTAGKPVKGDAAFQTEYNGAEWHFANQQNLDKFLADPAQYAPQYGGYCAWAVAAKGKLYSGDPLQWTVHEGKLYLNYNAKVNRTWRAKMLKFITAGDRKWPGVLN